MVKKILRILGLCVMACAILVFAMRGMIGISFLMGDKNFYPPAGRIVSPETSSFNFTILSDTGSQNKTLERLILDARYRTEPEFMLHLGDLIVYRNIEHLYWMLDEVNDKLEGIPMYFIPGNHDVKKKTGVDKTIYSRVLGPLYYWFGYGNTLFVGLDSSTEEIDDAQWAFFEQVMTKIRPKFKHVVLFTHVPPVVPEGDHPHTLKPEHAAKMAKMLKKYPVSVIFSGHLHYYSEQNFNDIPVYTVPPSGQYFAGPICKYGYLNVTVDKKGIHVENIYSDEKKRSEFWEILFVDLVMTDKIRWIAGGVLLGGFLIWLFGQRWFRIPLTKRKKN